MFPGTVLSHPKCFLHCNVLPWLGGDFIPEMAPSRQCTWDCIFMIPCALYSSLMLSWQALPSLAQPCIFPATFKGAVTHSPVQCCHMDGSHTALPLFQIVWIGDTHTKSVFSKTTATQWMTHRRSRTERCGLWVQAVCFCGNESSSVWTRCSLHCIASKCQDHILTCSLEASMYTGSPSWYLQYVWKLLC